MAHKRRPVRVLTEPTKRRPPAPVVTRYIRPAQPEVPVLRSDVLCRLLLERLASIGPMSEEAAIEALDYRAPGRGTDVVTYATQRGLIRRIPGQNDEPATLEAVSAPRTLAA